MFNNHSESISEIINVNNVIQYKYDIGKHKRELRNIYLKFSPIFFMIMFDNIKPSFINIYSYYFRFAYYKCCF